MNEAERFDVILSKAVSGYMKEWLLSDEFRTDKFSTSKSFEKKMSKMLKSEHSLYHKVTLTRGRRILCACIAIIILLLSSLSVTAVREAVANFFIEHFSNHNHIVFSTESDVSYPTKVEKVYELGYVPEGYELTDKSVMDTSVSYTYSNDGGMVLFVGQWTKDHFSVSADNERSHLTSEFIDGREYLINTYEDDEIIDMFWDNGEYIFEVLAYLPKDDVVNLCKSLKIKKIVSI